MDASMDDIEDLPPVGVPPNGYYRLEVNADQKQPKESGKNPYIRFDYRVVEVLELSNPSEAKEASVGMEFHQIFSPFKQDGTMNTVGVGLLKKTIQPYAAHFGTTSMKDAIAEINGLQISAVLQRWPDKKEAGRWNFSLTDIVID